MGAAGVVNRLHVAMVLFGITLFLLLMVILAAMTRGSAPYLILISFYLVSVQKKRKLSTF